MLINRIPMCTFQSAVYALLTTYQTTPVYDDVGDTESADVTYPCVSFGAYRCEPNGAKDVVIFDVSLDLEMWSNYEGKKEINEIADNLAAVYTSYGLDLSSDGFIAVAQGIDSLEAFPEEVHGYHGTLTITAKIQYLGGGTGNGGNTTG